MDTPPIFHLHSQSIALTPRECEELQDMLNNFFTDYTYPDEWCEHLEAVERFCLHGWAYC